MRYRSLHDRLLLVQNNGVVRHVFKRGVLVLGTPGGSGAGETIDTTQSVPPLPTELQAVFPSGATDPEKVGLNKNFWAAPPLAAADALVADMPYEVLAEPVSYDGRDYVIGERFIATATANFVGAGTVAVTIPYPPGHPECDPHYDEHFRIKHLLGSSAQVGVGPWTPSNTDGVTGPAPTFLAEGG